MGCLGLLAIQPRSLGPESRPPARYVLTSIVGGVMLFVLLGLAPETDVIAHVGGFISGLVLGGLLAVAPVLTRNAKANLFSGGIFVLLVIVPWGLALARR